MRSLAAALVATATLALPIPLVVWASGRALEFEVTAARMPAALRATLVMTNWYVRLLPLLALGLIAGATLVGALLSGASSVSQERRLLLGWSGVVLIDSALSASFWSYAPRWLATAWSVGLILGVVLSLVASVAVVVVATHLQARIRAPLRSRIKPWHVAAATVALAYLGPAMLVPPAWVWVRAGAVQLQDTARAMRSAR